MTIQEIKQNLSINAVLSYYGLKANKNKMLNCPFHEDKKPSMQIYEETDTAFCFSSNCQLHGKSIDQIDFIMHKEKLTKHESIEKAKQISGIIGSPKEEKDLEIIPNFKKKLNKKSKSPKLSKRKKPKNDRNRTRL